MRTVELLRHLDRDQFRFHFCTLSGETGSLDNEIRALGGEVYSCQLNWCFPSNFHRLIQEVNADVVHSHVHFFSGFILRQAAKAGVRSRIAHFRNTQDDHNTSIRRQLQRKIMRYWLNQYATSILSVSEGAMEAAWGKKWKTDPRCKVIYNGLDLANFAQPPDREAILREFGLASDSIIYIHVGRMDAQKNHTRLIAIFGKLAQQQKNAHLLSVGRGGNEIETQIRQQIGQLGLTGRVTLAGERTDVPRLLMASNVMIFPSLFEGLPGAVLEACAAGTPVLATNLPGVKEIEVYFPKLVHPFSLTESDSAWAKFAQKIGAEKCNHVSTREIFIQSPFDIEKCVQSNIEIWQTGFTK